jgi:hypothetical protein
MFALGYRGLRYTGFTFAAALCACWVLPSFVRAEGAIDGYQNWEQFSAAMKSLEASGTAKVTSLGKTIGEREVLLATLGTGTMDEKPAILILGNVYAPHLVGSELATRIAQRFSNDPGLKKVLDNVTFYIIPRPNPDASEFFFTPPFVERAGNLRATDDDRDGNIGEDPNEDLNGDGWITQIRIEDPAGKYLPHPDDERVLIPFDATKNEHGRYNLISEGIDNDEDGQWNEDGPGGTDFNRNFTFRYPVFKSGAGPHQISEIETRAVANFCFDHPNIAIVFSFTPEDTMFKPLDVAPGKEGYRIHTKVLDGDSHYLDHLTEEYCGFHGGTGCPTSPKGAGSFSEWAYFHFGRWSLAARGWWIPPDDEVPPYNKANSAKDNAKPDTRGVEDIQALHWFARHRTDGFVPWKKIDHPDFPDVKVEVGGIKPFLMLNPPAWLLDELAARHVEYLRRLTELLPDAKIEKMKVEAIGEDVYRVTLSVVNHGFLPTMTEMGNITHDPHHLQLQLELPEDGKFIAGHRRQQTPAISGGGGEYKHHWVVQIPSSKGKEIAVKLWSPSVGKDEKKETLP